MPTYTLETPRGKRLTIEAANDRDALDLADRWDLEDHAASEAQRLGVNPDLVLRQMKVESGGNPKAVSPKGARGPMQLMPGTAKDLGVNPDDPYENVTGGVTYLKRQLDAYGGDERKALAAYNAGPGAVNRYGGVPPYAETQRYVAALANKPGAASPPTATPKPPQRQPAAARASQPSLGDLAVSGFAQPFRTLVDDLGAHYKDVTSRVGRKPVSPLTAAKEGLSDLGANFGLIGDVLGLAGAPAMAAVRPTAAAMNKVATPTVGPQLTFQGGKPGLTAPRKLQGEEAQRFVENNLMTALSAARPANVQPVRPNAPKPMKLDELKAASDAAWSRVDASGYRFPQTDVHGAASDIRQIVNDAGPELYPKATQIAKRVEDLAARGDLTPAQANRLRSQVGEKLLSPGSDEVSVGGAIKARIDQLIDGANDPNIASARDLYTRYVKVRDVTNRADSAELRAASTYAGGNKANATRQNLRPSIDPKSPQRIRNLTPDEAKAFSRVVKGTPGANAARVAGKLLDPRGLLGASVQTAFGIPTHGLSTVTAPLGMAASGLSNKLTMNSLQDLIDLMSIGGVKPVAPPPVSSIAGPFAPLPLPTRLLGAAEVAQQPARARGALAVSRETHKAARKPTRR
jgi:hypothetical protein